MTKPQGEKHNEKASFSITFVVDQEEPMSIKGVLEGLEAGEYSVETVLQYDGIPVSILRKKHEKNTGQD